MAWSTNLESRNRESTNRGTTFKGYILIEGLQGVEVIADDCIVVGCGDNEEQATKKYDTNMESFMKNCKKKRFTSLQRRHSSKSRKFPLSDISPQDKAY